MSGKKQSEEESRGPSSGVGRPLDPEQLRRQAEERVGSIEEAVPDFLRPEEVRRALHELRVHQVELEMQNEELRRAQVELEVSRARYFDLYDLAPVGYCTIGENNLILEANLTAATLFGTARGMIPGRPFSRFILEEDRDAFYLYRKRLFETGEAQVCELRMQPKDGSPFWVRMDSTLARNEEGEPVCRSVMTDISERKRAEAELMEARCAAEAASRAKSAFLSNMSHEIRTPLAAMLGMTDVLLSMDPDPEQEGALRMMMDSGRSLVGIIGDILDFSLIEAGKLAIVQEAFDLHSLVRGVAGLLQVTAKAKDIELSFDIPPDIPKVVVGDPLRLRQVLTNLAGNAVKFTDHGHIRVRVEKAPTEKQGGTALDLPLKLLFTVEDTGPGIPAEARPLLFTPFIQGDGPYSKRHSGTGLGLAISKQFVERMGGEIWFETEVGEGSKFCFTAVLQPTEKGSAEAETGIDPATPPVEEEIGPLRLLLVEDEIIIQKATCHILEKAGHRVVCANDGRQALEALAGEPFDLILMDIQMPEMDGLEATRRIRSSTSGHFDPDIPVIALTAYAMKEDRDKCLEAGMDDHLSKPVLKRELDRVIRKVRQAKSRTKPRCTAWEVRHEAVDVEELIAQYRGNEHVLRELTSLFLELIPEKRELLRRALNENDAGKLRELAHTLVGTLGTVMATKAAQVAGELETAAGEGDMERARSVHEKLDAELGRAVDFFSRRLGADDAGTPPLSSEPCREGSSPKLRDDWKARVLVVEDELLIATRLKRSLENLRYEVCSVAASGEEAVWKASEDAPDLVLMDIQLDGEMDGIEAAEQIRARTSIPVIFVTGHADDGLIERARATLPHGYLVKPVQEKDLKAAVEVALYVAGVEAGRKLAEEDREKMRAQLLQAQKLEAVGRLAGGVAHDFNNMLGIILGHAELMEDEIRSEAPLHHDLMEIKKAAQRSADLTRQLLAFARKQAISPRVLDLNETASGILKMLRRLIGEDIALAWKPGFDIWPVKMDPGQIDQVLANLAVNARDAMAGVGSMTIETANVELDETTCRTHEGLTPGSYVLLSVSDTGSGMDKETFNHIFEPFFTTKEVGKGTGLGLATVYGIVKQNKGAIDVFSDPGKGATFRIYLPRADVAVAGHPAEASNRDLKGTETVLLVEDEEPMLALAETILKRHGYTVLATSSPIEALAMAQNHDGPIHLLVTDVVLPEMNGKDLRDKLASIRPGLRCLFISGYTTDIIAHRGVVDDRAHLLEKPFSVQSLAERVREALDA